MSHLRALGIPLMLLFFVWPSAQAEPEAWECVIPPEHDPLMRDLREVECGVGTQAWEYVWYYPPGPYQAWCFLTGDCYCPHCPDAFRPYE